MAKSKKNVPQSWVYFVRYAKDGPIKIGVTGDVPRRIAALQTACPYPLELVARVPGTRELEGQIHTVFAYDWMSGEWFKPSQRLLDFIDNLVTHDEQTRAQEAAINPLGQEHSAPKTRHCMEDKLLDWIDKRKK